MTLIFFYLFLICSCLQLAFYLSICAPFAFSKREEEKRPSLQKFVSVVIAARNEAENLPSLLEQLAEQNYDNYEVIIVNDRSTDNSGAILDKWSSEHKWLKYLQIDEVPAHINPKKNALQVGIEQAKGEVLLFTDADCTPLSNNWIESMASAYTNDGVSVVLGFSDYEEKNTLLNRLIRWDTFYTAVQYFSLAQMGLPYMGVGRNLSYKKSLFKKSGKFSRFSNIIGGDDDLLVGRMATKNNTALIYTPDSQTVSKPEPTWSLWFKQKHRHLSVGVYYPLKIKLILGLIQLSFIFLYLLLFVLLILAYKIVIIATVYLFRTATTWIILNRIAIKFYGKKRKWQLLSLMPIFELFYVAYYTVAGIAALLNRKVKWK
mgnify:CR=1 FL=1